MHQVHFSPQSDCSERGWGCPEVHLWTPIRGNHELWRKVTKDLRRMLSPSGICWMNEVTLSCYSFSFESAAHTWRRPLLVVIVRKGDEECSGSRLLQAVPADWVQRGEHDVLACLRGAEEGDQQDCGWGESPSNIRGLHLHPLSKRGEALMKKEVLSSVSLSVLYQCKAEVNTPLMYHKTPLVCAFPLGQSRFARSRRDKPEHAGANLAHVRGGPTADLHADAEGLVPTLHQLSHIHGSAEEPGGASSRAIRLTHTFPK